MNGELKWTTQLKNHRNIWRSNYRCFTIKLQPSKTYSNSLRADNDHNCTTWIIWNLHRFEIATTTTAQQGSHENCIYLIKPSEFENWLITYSNYFNFMGACPHKASTANCKRSRRISEKFCCVEMHNGSDEGRCLSWDITIQNNMYGMTNQFANLDPYILSLVKIARMWYFPAKCPCELDGNMKKKYFVAFFCYLTMVQIKGAPFSLSFIDSATMETCLEQLQ